MNILTFDVEEWFHLLDFDATRTEAEWGKYEVRIHDNVDRILDILDSTNTKATFFIIGWVAKTYPEVVKKIAVKYQIGTHTMSHQLVWQQTPLQFLEDLDSSIKLLQDITGQPIDCFRAPGFSIRETEPWAFDILSELGIKYDCSVFPAAHAHGGMPSYADAMSNGVCPAIIKHGDVELKEFPVTTKDFLGRQLVFSGGGYFRLVPYFLLHKWSSETEYLLSYIHPRDFDGGQPMLEGLPLSRKFKSYVGLKQAPEKLCRYLNDFKFTDVETAATEIDWTKVPIVEI